MAEKTVPLNLIELMGDNKFLVLCLIIAFIVSWEYMQSETNKRTVQLPAEVQSPRQLTLSREVTYKSNRKFGYLTFQIHFQMSSE